MGPTPARLLKPPVCPGATGVEEVHGPAVEVDAVDLVFLALSRFQEVFARRVVGVGDGAVTVAVVDGVLAPDVPLADVDAFGFGEITQVLGGEEAGDHAARPIAVAHHLRHEPKPVVQVTIHLLAGVVHVREVSGRKKGDLVAELLVVGDHELPQGLVVRPLVVQREPGEGPGDPCPGPARAMVSRNSFASAGVCRLDSSGP